MNRNAVLAKRLLPYSDRKKENLIGLSKIKRLLLNVRRYNIAKEVWINYLQESAASSEEDSEDKGGNSQSNSKSSKSGTRVYIKSNFE